MEQDKDILKDEELTARNHDIVWQVNKSWEHNRYIEGLVAEIIDTHGAVINLDIQDIKAMKKSGGEIVGIESCVPADSPNRMATLIEQIQLDGAFERDFNRIILKFFYPEDNPLMMEEQAPLTEWMESLSNEDTVFIWGLASEENSNLLRAIYWDKKQTETTIQNEKV